MNMQKFLNSKYRLMLRFCWNKFIQHLDISWI